jgi:uncharacterized protein
MRASHRPCLVLSPLPALLVLGLLGAAPPARAVTIEQIPSPRPTGWAIDLTGTLSPENLAEINRLGNEAQSRTGAELAVVVVSSTDGVDSHAFATRLFNTWGIGQTGKNNGLLVFAALADHKAEIILGNGLDITQNRAASKGVMREVILPRFRAGDPSGAIVQGALGCARRILDVSLPVTEAQAAPSDMAVGTAAPATAAATSPVDTPPIPPRQNPVPTPDSFAGSSEEGGDGWRWIWMGGGLGALLLVYGLFLLRAPRCPRCKEKMRQLDEAADDVYLEPAEKVEERIGSVDYQIWLCPACGEHTKRQGSRFFSRYQTCPECRARTLGSTSTTVETATTYRCGQIEIHEACENCSYQNTYTRTTPMLEDRTTYTSSVAATAATSAALYSASSSSSSDTSSSSSSSSGFSGGDSSGGGASGSW